MVYDLHCHSTASDGELTPAALVELAVNNGVTTLAITDHDNITGYLSLDHQAYIGTIELIAGIEFSALWGSAGIHIVGLNVDPASASLLAGIEHQHKVRQDRAQMINRKLEKRGIKNALSGAEQIAGNGLIGRPHFARFLMEQGLVTSMEEAFKKYLGNSKIGGMQSGWPSIETIVQWIIDAGGVAVLAHPKKYKLTRTKFRALVRQFKACGGQGLEVVSGNQTPEVTSQMSKICSEFGLVGSTGSDFHSPQQRWAQLGKSQSLPSECQPVWSLW